MELLLPENHEEETRDDTIDSLDDGLGGGRSGMNDQLDAIPSSLHLSLFPQFRAKRRMEGE